MGFARGQQNALTDAQKRGALLFFARHAMCRVSQSSANSNEMFSDFTSSHRLPQIAPVTGNVTFDGRSNEDFGLEQITGNSSDRYKFFELHRFET